MMNTALKESLFNQYSESCHLCGTYPELHWSREFTSATIHIDLSFLNSPHLEVICHCLSQSITPHSVTITCSKTFCAGNKAKLLKVLKALRICLKLSSTFENLYFIGIPFGTTSLEILCNGLSQMVTLKVLSFEKCLFPVKAHGIRSICQSIKNRPSLNTISFLGCRLKPMDVNNIKYVIQHQSLNRSAMLWEDSLRENYLQLDTFRGLRKIRLNNNPLIGDEGLSSLLEALIDDIWVTDIHMENCGLTSADRISEMLSVNEVIHDVNIKRNPFVSAEDIRRIEDITSNRRKQEFNVKQLVMETTIPTHREASTTTENKLIPTWPPKSGIPWRIESRIIERKEGVPAGSLYDIHQEAKRVTQSLEMEEPLTTVPLNIVEKLICFYKSKIKQEKKQRKVMEKKSKRLQTQITDLENQYKNSFVIDEPTLTNIESCFQKFESFLTQLPQSRERKFEDFSDLLELMNQMKLLKPIEKLDVGTQYEISESSEIYVSEATSNSASLEIDSPDNFNKQVSQKTKPVTKSPAELNEKSVSNTSMKSESQKPDQPVSYWYDFQRTSNNSKLSKEQSKSKTESSSYYVPNIQYGADLLEQIQVEERNEDSGNCETDEEKLKQWISGKGSTLPSGTSISEQLSESHEKWNCGTKRNEKDTHTSSIEDISNLDGINMSVSSIGTSTALEDLS